MSLVEFEKTHIEPLTREEKKQLIKDIQRMLQEESLQELGVISGAVCEIATPNVIADPEAEAKGVAAMEKFLKEKNHAL